MNLRFKIGLTVFYHALLSTCLFPQLLLVTAEQNCIQTLNERCTTPYERTVEAVERRDPTDNPAFCTALAIYLRCFKDVKKNVKSCNSNLYFHTISTLIPRLMKDRNCGNVSLPINKTVLTTPATRRPVTNQPACLNFKHEQITLARGKINQGPHQYRLCALFGDPHLKTFTEERQTCVVQGAWPLLDNEYFSVQVTNVPLVSGSSATATNTITVVIKPRGNGCVLQKIYRAQVGSLPAEFLDGTFESGPLHCPARIYTRRKGPQTRTHIEIKICYISTTIIIRQVGQFLTFHVKVPEQLLWRFPTDGLCVTGCPYLQRIDYRELLSFTDDQLARLRPRRSKMSRKEAYEKCMEKKIAGFYLDSCLFDLLTTGDQNFSAAAWHALDDSFVLDELGTLKDIQSYNTTQPRKEVYIPSYHDRKPGRNTCERNVTNSFCKLWTSLIILFAFVVR